MDLDQLLSESGARWRQAQGAVPPLDVERLVTDREPTRARLKTTAIAVAAVLITVAASFVLGQVAEPAVTPVPSAPPAASQSGITPVQVTGTWYHTVSLTMARSQHRALVGEWILTLDPDGSAQLARSDGTVTVPGRWSLTAGTLTMALPVRGCTDPASTYRADRSTLHSGLLELIPGNEGCLGRAILLGGHWFSTPSPA